MAWQHSREHTAVWHFVSCLATLSLVQRHESETCFQGVQPAVSNTTESSFKHFLSNHHHRNSTWYLHNCVKFSSQRWYLWTLTSVYFFSFLESSQLLCSQSLSVLTERSQMEKTPSGLSSAGNPAQQQQMSAVEQKSRMDLQMSTALHGTTAFTRTDCRCVTQFCLWNGCPWRMGLLKKKRCSEDGQVS